MARYGIALGGNKRNFEWDNIYASGNTAGDIRYASHLKRRHYGLPFDFDGAACDWAAYFSMEVPLGNPVVGDIFDVQYINEGTHVNRVVIHNKRAAPGLTFDLQFMDSLGVAVGPVIPFDAATVGFIGLGGAGLNVGMPKNGSLTLKLTAGDMRDGCFGVTSDLFDGKSQKACACPVEECEVVDPTPECFTPEPGCF